MASQLAYSFHWRIVVGKCRSRHRSATFTSAIITGTSMSGPITAANACPEPMPNTPTATAMASLCLGEHISPMENYL